MLNLEKVLEKDSLRWMGENYDSLFPNRTVIAGKDISSISNAINLPCYKFSGFNIQNIFVAHDSQKIFYVFVNPRYKNYRKAFHNLIGQIPDNFHVDHVLSRNLAMHFGYNYVLLCMIPGIVNSSHGRFEKIKAIWDIAIPEVCYSDDRVFHKILSRNPNARQTREELLSGYHPAAVPTYGLTLKQRGIWNSAFGFGLINMETLIAKTSKI